MNLEINAPIFGFRGKNGSGKTTLALLLCRMLSPHDGTIEFIDIHNQTHERIPTSYIDQNGTAFSLNLENNLFLEKLPQFQFLHHFPEVLQNESIGSENISSGQRKAISIERALQHASSLLIIDEPENALDYGEKKGISKNPSEKEQCWRHDCIVSHTIFFWKFAQTSWICKTWRQQIQMFHVKHE